MAEFAIRSLATMAERNPFIRTSGRVPHLGSHLIIYNHGRYVVALLACIVGVHFALLVATAWVTKSVVVTDDSFVAIARLLNGMTKGFKGMVHCFEETLYAKPLQRNKVDGETTAKWSGMSRERDKLRGRQLMPAMVLSTGLSAWGLGIMFCAWARVSTP